MRLHKIRSAEELAELVQEVGFLPLLPCGLNGWSVFDLTEPDMWESRTENNPWEWRYQLAGRQDLAYGKLFRSKIGFVSRDWYPCFANIRREGCDFDTLFDEGRLSRTAAQIMALFLEGAALPTWEIKRLVPDGQLEKHLTLLQMRGYLILSGFEQKRNRYGEGYGWPSGVYATPESRFGTEFVRACYHETPADSLARAIAQCAEFCTTATERTIQKFLTA